MGQKLERNILSFFCSSSFAIGSFLLLLFVIPVQKRCHKWLRPLSNALTAGCEALPSYFEKHLAFYLSDVLTLCLFVLFIAAGRVKLRELFSGSAKYLLLFFFCCLLSLASSSQAHFLFQYFKLLHFSISILFFCLLIHSLNPLERQRLIRLSAYAVAAIALFESFVGIAQYLLQHHLRLHSLGEVALNAGFPVAEGSRSLLGSFFPLQPGQTGIFRAQGTFPHANIFGGFLFFSILFTYLLLYQSQRRSLRILFCFVLLFQFLALCLSFSRSALIAWALASLLWMGYLIAKQQRAQRKKTALLGAFVLLGAAACLFFFYPQLTQRGGLFNYNHLAQGADSIRMLFNLTALDMVKEHPLFGIGYNNFLLYIHEYAPESLHPVYYYYVHNIYLLIAAEEGLLGLLAFLLFLGSVLYTGLRGAMSPEKMTFLALFLGFLFIGLCDFYPLVSVHGRALFFSSAGMLLIASPKGVLLKEREGELVAG